MKDLLSLAVSIGFLHAFEADHLVAVSGLVSGHSKLKMALKDGAYWGLGHTSILLLMGLLFMFGKFAIPNQYFKYLEAIVGLMLVFIGVFRLKNIFIAHKKSVEIANNSHKMAYGVGLIHGLAGSGAVLISMLALKNDYQSNIMYIIIFGIGSIIGMMIVSALCSFPFALKFLKNKKIIKSFSLISCLACIFFGGLIFYRNFS